MRDSREEWSTETNGRGLRKREPIWRSLLKGSPHKLEMCAKKGIAEGGGEQGRR